ncbi:MAG: hypothetical protein IRZ07_15930 [Microbispora sp.]|nr:hypothetical protein [Microbispora sp.]
MPNRSTTRHRPRRGARPVAAAVAALAAAATMISTNTPALERYGLHWWLGGPGEKDFMAAGLGGRHIYVSPEHDVVIAKSVVSPQHGRVDQEEALTVFRAVAAEVARTRN